MGKLAFIIFILLVIFFLQSSNQVNPIDVQNDYKSFTLSVANTVASFQKISPEINSVEAADSFCTVADLVIDKAGMNTKVSSFCKIGDILGNIEKFKPLYNRLIDTANLLNSQSTEIELDNFNSQLGEMIGKFIYSSNANTVVWILESCNSTLNVSQKQIEKGDQQIYEAMGKISASATPSMIKLSIHSGYTLDIMIDEAKCFLNSTSNNS